MRLTRADTFLKHHFEPYGYALGPDFGFGLALRQQGLKNYADLSVRCDHLKQDGTSIAVEHASPAGEAHEGRDRLRQTV